MFLYELSGFGWKSSCSHFIFRISACFGQGVPWHSGNYRVWIHSEMRTWHDKNMQSNAPHRKVLSTQLNHLVSWAKWLSVGLRSSWFLVRVQLQWYCAATSSKEFLDIQATIECGFTLKCVPDMTRTYSQKDRGGKYSEHSSIIWSVWPNIWVFVY